MPVAQPGAWISAILMNAATIALAHGQVDGIRAVKAGLDGLTPHELRHTAVSLAVSAGANVKAVQRMLGTLRRR